MDGKESNRQSDGGESRNQTGTAAIVEQLAILGRMIAMSQTGAYSSDAYWMLVEQMDTIYNEVR